MRHERLFIIPVSLLLVTLCGCGTLPGRKSSAVSVSAVASTPAKASALREQERSFAGALEFLRAGREQDARELLEEVLEGPQRSGVTDEALFRLALLSLRDESRGGTRTQDYLERLRSEFPTSIWTHQSAPLTTYLAAVRTLRERQREVRTLKELNLSLSRDNREMRQSLERLKSLDLELEKKIKR